MCFFNFDYNLAVSLVGLSVGLFCGLEPHSRVEDPNCWSQLGDRWVGGGSVKSRGADRGERCQEDERFLYSFGLICTCVTMSVVVSFGLCC